MAHTEGLSWFSRRTNQFRYSINGQDQWIQPLSVYTAGEAIKRGQPVSVAVLADFNDSLIGLVADADNIVVLTRPARHTYSIGLALESVAAGGLVHILESGRFTFTQANSAEYWSSIFTSSSNGSLVYASPLAPGSFTFDPVVAITGANLIQIGSVSNTAGSAGALVLDIEVSITGDGRGPLDNTQFEMIVGEPAGISYTGAAPYNFPPLCAIADGTGTAPAGTAILADNSLLGRSNVIGFLINPPQASPFTTGVDCIFLRKGRLNVSGSLNALIPGARYYLGVNGKITPLAGSVVYPNALVEVGTAVSTTELIVDISTPLLGVNDYPLGTLRPLISGQPAFAGYLVCDGVTQYPIVDYQQFYGWAITQSPPIVTTVGAAAGWFIVLAQNEPSTGSPYQIAAYAPEYQPLVPITDYLRSTGTLSAAGLVTLDLTPFTTSGPQNGPLTIDQFLPELYATVGGTLTKVNGTIWTLTGNILTGTNSTYANDYYVLVVYKPEALARYQETTNILSIVNTASGYAVNSTAVVNYLANNGVAGTLTLGNDVAGSVVRILGAIQFGDTSTIDSLTIQGSVFVKTDAGVTVLAIDNASGNVLVSTSQSYPTNAGHLVNKAYSDLHDLNTTVAINGAFVNGVYSNAAPYNTGVHGILMGVGGGFDADMVDERYVGGWGWRSDTSASVAGTSNLPLARANYSIPEITAAGALEAGKAINLYLTAVATKPAVYPAGNNVVSTTIQTLGATNAVSYLQITNPNSSVQGIQIGNPVNANAVNLIAVGSALLVTYDIPSATPTFFAAIKASSFQTVSTIKAKESVESFGRSGLEIIKGTQIVSYNLKNDDRPRVGFIAEWTDELLAGKNHDENDIGTTLGVALKAIQELAEDNAALREELEEIKARL